jgi:hypothetical protein
VTLQPERPERHRAPALWLVLAATVATVLTAQLAGVYPAIGVLIATLALAAVARLIGRGRRPEGIAVRATWVDLLILVALAGALALLAGTPGVA